MTTRKRWKHMLTVLAISLGVGACTTGSVSEYDQKAPQGESRAAKNHERLLERYADQ